MSLPECTGKRHNGFGKWSKTCTLQVRKPPLVLMSFFPVLLPLKILCLNVIYAEKRYSASRNTL